MCSIRNPAKQIKARETQVPQRGVCVPSRAPDRPSGRGKQWRPTTGQGAQLVLCCVAFALALPACPRNGSSGQGALCKPPEPPEIMAREESAPGDKVGLGLEISSR